VLIRRAPRSVFTLPPQQEARPSCPLCEPTPIVARRDAAVNRTTRDLGSHDGGHAGPDTKGLSESAVRLVVGVW
jgi:hypothetical protein